MIDKSNDHVTSTKIQILDWIDSCLFAFNSEHTQVHFLSVILITPSEDNLEWEELEIKLFC